MVSKRTGTVITAALAVLFGCGGLLTCAAGTITAPFSSIPYGDAVSWLWFGANMCTGLGYLALPVVFYIILVASNKETPAAGPEVKDTPQE